MQIKNLILFIVLSAAVVAGWVYLQNRLAKDEQAKTEPAKPAVGKLLARAWDNAKAGAAATANVKPLGRLLVEAWQEAKRHDAVAGRDAKRHDAIEHQQLVTLGSDNAPYDIKAVVTTLGAGVRSLTLNKFHGADDDGKDTGELLELIEPDTQVPSFLLYHYPPGEQKGDTRPVDDLGVTAWKFGKLDPKANQVEPITWDEARARAGKNPVQEVTLFTDDVPGYPGLTVVKTFELAPGEYHLKLTIRVIDTRDNRAGKETRSFRYQLTGPHGLPVEGKWYTATTRTAMTGLVDPKGNLWRLVEDARRISLRGGGDRVPENQLNEYVIQYAGVATQYFASMIAVNNTADQKGPRPDVPLPILQWARPTLEFTEVKGKITRVDPIRRTMTLEERDDKKIYMHDFVLPKDCKVTLTGTDDTIADLRVGDIVFVGYHPAPWRRVAQRIHAAKIPHQGQFDDITVRVNSEALKLDPGQSKSHEFLLYNGPIKVRLLGQMDDAVEAGLLQHYESQLHLSTLTDYHYDNVFGTISNAIHLSPIIIWFTNLMHWLLHQLHNIVPVYGLCIIMLTVLVRGLMFPISRKQAYLSIKMQALAPELKKVQEKYKNDPQEKTRAMMELYRKHGVNPLGGCLPLLLQLPIFMGLYYALQESIFFRLAPFLWIDNLAAPDMLFWWSTKIPFISDPNNLGGLGYLGPYFNILPVLAVTLMIVQQKMLTPPPTDETQATQQKIMKYMMIFFGLMFYKVAAGLCLYFIASSLWGLAERKLLPKRKPLGALPQSEAGGPPRGGKSPAKPGPRPKKAPPSKKDRDGTFQKVRDWWADVLKQAKKK
jgi:YidC/Oxa1 family membrane protein insertase